MATTKNGIYYPNDGTKPADILSDMKKMAESIDENIQDNKYDPTTSNKDITDLKKAVNDIKKEQTTQNENIKDNTTAIEKNAESIKQNTTDITKLREENTMLKVQIPKGQVTGEEISLSDSAEMPLVDFYIQGNSKQVIREGYNLVKASNKFRKGVAGTGIIGSVTTEGYLQVVAEEGNANYINSFWSLDGQESIKKIKDILKVGDTFTIAFTIKRTEGTSKAPMVYIKENSSYKTMSGSVTTSFSQVYYTGTWEDGFDISIIHLGFANLTGTFIIKDWMVKKGNIAEWQEYGVSPSLDYPSEVEAVGDSGNVEIVTSNKNVLDLGQGSANGITYNKNRITIINPTNSINITSLNLINNKNFMGKNLTLTFWANGNVETNNVEVHLSTNKETYRFQKYFTTGNFNNTKFAFTRQLQSDEYFTNMTVYVPTTALPTCNLTIDLQMEIKTATDFIEHKGNTYTLPIQKPFYMLHFDGDVNISQKATVRDSFILKDGKWCEKHNIAKVNLEDINWYKGSAEAGTENTYKRWNSIAKYKDDKCGIAGSSNRLAISNYLANQYYKIFNVDKIGFNIENSEICIRFPISTANSPEEIKNFWQEKANEGNGAYILYPSKEPELTECTEEQVQVLEQIVKDGTYKGITHYYTNDEVKPTLEVTYYKDLETLLNKQEQLESTLNNVQAQILELGG